ncbi:unnamed protein product [Ilex paraguariensis]|uniref:4a-hydroxytetrahydrobiopterin dehydratase n=1 Tax=Ilex paraguariensis TaxID=185542 RepID=A0ABC8S2S3_9AQUA
MLLANVILHILFFFSNFEERMKRKGKKPNLKLIIAIEMVDHIAHHCLFEFSDLSTKKCVPCNSEDLRPMTKEAANELIQKIPEWNLVNEDGMLKLHRSWKVKSFTKGMEFFQVVANVAEAEGISST